MLDFLHDTLHNTFEVDTHGTCGYFKWHCPAAGALVFEPEGSCDTSILISAGIHGNETAPVEIVDQLVTDIFAQKLLVNARVMVLLGNVDALKQGMRYRDFDMNRLFGAENNTRDHSSEVLRAETIKQLTVDFFRSVPNHKRIHLDLHTAIRASNHERFGVLPYVEDGRYPGYWIQFLQSVGLDALVINHAPSSTYSYFTRNICSADSVTLELGKALPFGHNDLAKFQSIKDGLYALVSGESGVSVEQYSQRINVYKVTQVLTKKSESFQLNFSDDVSNFAEFRQGELLATDGDFTYRVEQEKEYVIFPNNNVKVGLRGGLMLVEDNLENHVSDD